MSESIFHLIKVRRLYKDEWTGRFCIVVLGKLKWSIWWVKRI